MATGAGPDPWQADPVLASDLSLGAIDQRYGGMERHLSDMLHVDMQKICCNYPETADSPRKGIASPIHLTGALPDIGSGVRPEYGEMRT